MADKKISALTGASTPLAGTEVLPIVQSGSTVKVLVNDLTVKNIRANATTGVLQVTGPAAGTTRVMTTPDANFTVARTDSGQTFAGSNNFSSNVWLQDATLLQGGFTGLRWSIGGTDELNITPRTGNSVTINGSSRFTLQGAFESKIWMRDAATLEGGFNTLRWTIGGTDDLLITPRTGYNTKLVDGNLVIGTSGKGIDFSATADAGGMTSELLDDYEEGTFTPTLEFGGANTGITYAVNAGSYTKIGRLVTGRFVMVLSSKGVATGGALIAGLPFTVDANDIGSAVTEICSDFASNAPSQGFCNNAGTTITPWVISATGTTFTTDADFNNNTRLDMWFQYFV